MLPFWGRWEAVHHVQNLQGTLLIKAIWVDKNSRMRRDCRQILSRASGRVLCSFRTMITMSCVHELVQQVDTHGTVAGRTMRTKQPLCTAMLREHIFDRSCQSNRSTAHQGTPRRQIT